jgi:hypothetical protein
MTKMSKTQRTAVLDFHNGVTSKRHTLVAGASTIQALIRNGWAIKTSANYRTAYVTTAGLIAAGVDMAAIEAEALDEAAERAPAHIRTNCPALANGGCMCCTAPATVRAAHGDDSAYRPLDNSVKRA